MKFAVVLLSITVIFLNAVPCCWDTCEEDISIEETSGVQDSCSPFLSCGSCAGFVLQQDFSEILSFTAVFSPLHEQVEVSFQSDYSIEIWQPPKEV